MRFPTMLYASDQPAHQSLCLSLEYSMTVKLPTEHHLEFLRLKRGCIGSSESSHIKMPHCLKLHVMAQLSYMSKVMIQAYIYSYLVGLDT